MFRLPRCEQKSDVVEADNGFNGPRWRSLVGVHSLLSVSTPCLALLSISLTDSCKGRHGLATHQPTRLSASMRYTLCVLGDDLLTRTPGQHFHVGEFFDVRDVSTLMAEPGLHVLPATRPLQTSRAPVASRAHLSALADVRARACTADHNQQEIHGLTVYGAHHCGLKCFHAR